MSTIEFSASLVMYFFYKLFRKSKSVKAMDIIIKSVTKSQRDIDIKYFV